MLAAAFVEAYGYFGADSPLLEGVGVARSARLEGAWPVFSLRQERSGSLQVYVGYSVCCSALWYDTVYGAVRYTVVRCDAIYCDGKYDMVER